jgi:hypothetical protein
MPQDIFLQGYTTKKPQEKDETQVFLTWRFACSIGLRFQTYLHKTELIILCDTLCAIKLNDFLQSCKNYRLPLPTFLSHPERTERVIVTNTGESLYQLE